ncbi:aKG-HExxH-type peptide beta-hydroxylase [Martelella alba]|uniref:Histidine kinase n=1 Tax=Martelella alba TaxID=2590451 RepID=A0ABY2SKG3_9HYPH|nr:HEXXH motif-containing putative peptide modification protein [Martelella alba]TKI06066.1 histidine kinase [Martelella alba]
MFDIVLPGYDHIAAREYFSANLLASINYLSEFYELKKTVKPPPLTWQVCAAHYLAMRCAESEAHGEAIKYLEYLNTVSPAEGIAVSPLTVDDHSFQTAMMLKIIKDDRELGFGFCNDLQLAAVETEKIYQALDVIQDYAPAAYDEIHTYLHAVHLTRETEDGSRFMRSGTNFYMWGMMFVYVHNEHTVPYYIDILAHECGHTALNILNAFDELVLNDPSETYEAPLRADNRPMIGLFHAFFVLSRICSVFKQISRADADQYTEECRERFNGALAKLQATYVIVKKNAQFTQVGERIYNGICELWELD